MTNTERLIANFNACAEQGVNCHFMVGRYTGNGPSVVAALRRRGYTVERSGSGYVITAGPVDAGAATASTEPVLTTCESKRPMGELCDLWNKLADTCVTPDGEELDEPFLHFAKGELLMDVWHWFEEQNPAFRVGEAGRFIGQDHPFRKGLVERALAHIASIHPGVNQVVYDDDLRWLYSANGVPITFTKQEDIGLLEDAADEAYERGLQNTVIRLHA
ncbi:MAG: hypothetical protein ITG07_02350 [Candidimonas sp.]|nr:hypothetical protein [Candidimonas sp.]